MLTLNIKPKRPDGRAFEKIRIGQALLCIELDERGRLRLHIDAPREIVVAREKCSGDQ